jgi:Domain of unknown function (DUF5666)
MKSKIKIPVRISTALSIALLLAFPLVASVVNAQAAAAPASSRSLGTITAISGTSITVKTDAGAINQVQVPATASIKRIAPGQTDLSTAVTIQFSELATGDRVLVRIDPDSPPGSSQAQQIIAIKKQDVAQLQQKEREDWQQRGVGGLVKSVDLAAGVIVLDSGSGATAKTITVHTTKATVLKRYAPASVSFDSAKPAPIDAIHTGDQLRARGAKNADGTDIAAEEVVSGTFRNLSGIVSSVDTSASAFTLKDLATKKDVTVHVTTDAQMRKLPDTMARALATRLTGGASGGGRGGNGQQAAAGAGYGQRGGQAGGDSQQLLNRAPAIQFADLKKGDAVMLVSTDGTTDVTAITLLAGVEPLLEAPAASESLLNNWSMGTGGAEEAAAAQ